MVAILGSAGLIAERFPRSDNECASIVSSIRSVAKISRTNETRRVDSGGEKSPELVIKTWERGNRRRGTSIAVQLEQVFLPPDPDLTKLWGAPGELAVID